MCRHTKFKAEVEVNRDVLGEEVRFAAFVTSRCAECGEPLLFDGAEEAELPATLHAREPLPSGGVRLSPPGKTLACGVTAVPERETLLRQTLSQLRAAGFDPRVFLDGRSGQKAGAFGNWFLAAYELLLTGAKRVAIFQDDVTCDPRAGAEVAAFDPDDGYLNLILYPEYRTAESGWRRSPQRGLGAQGLVFRTEHLRKLLSLPKFIGWRRHNNIDRAVQYGMRDLGLCEYVRSPSLLGHVQGPSAIGNKPQPTIGVGDA